MPKFTVTKLIDQKKVVPARLLPEQSGDNLEWSVDDINILQYNPKTKQFSFEEYAFQDDDYELVNTLGHDVAYQIALDEGIIYE
jgi:hypothetical protein